ncbi:MAG TPA: PhnD/SsuA/transferrin family substrate-binding protein [bacterium]|nr:PhnD/SsuA/transferrin family substrate-binding protein [bacterium]HOL47595.1 PhnD/SsuA/transferrin family substrate-binding protein [bacterium]HPQ18722.1 PhnD/SsuA/transferrin family substrate-binding protein [bacterium]
MNKGKKIILLIIVLFLFQILYANEPASIFFYNPDSNIENFALLVTNFTNYFKGNIPDFKIQPFVNIETLVNEALKRNPAFIILPYWNYLLLLKDKSFNPLGLEGILTPMVNSNVFYKKLILIKSNSSIKDIANLEGKAATTSLGLQSVDFLNEFLFQDKVDLKKITFIWTKKDMDSLLALKFNQVQIGIISDKTYSETKKTQAAMLSDIKVLKESKEIPEIVLIELKNNSDAKISTEIKKLFLNMHNSDDGKKILQLLNYDKWVEFKK